MKINLEFMLCHIDEENFLEYLNLIDKTLEEQGKEMVKLIEEQKAKASTDEEIRMLDMAMDGEAESFSAYIELAYESFIVWLYAYLEKRMNGFCNRPGKRNDSSLKLVDIAGKGIKRAKTFMKKVRKWQLPEENLWEKLIYLSEIRNAIVHNGGIIKEENLKKIKKFINERDKEEIFYRPDGKIALNKNYCIKLMDWVFEYLRKLSKLKKS